MHYEALTYLKQGFLIPKYIAEGVTRTVTPFDLDNSVQINVKAIVAMKLPTAIGQEQMIHGSPEHTALYNTGSQQRRLPNAEEKAQIAKSEAQERLQRLDDFAENKAPALLRKHVLFGEQARLLLRDIGTWGSTSYQKNRIRSRYERLVKDIYETRSLGVHWLLDHTERQYAEQGREVPQIILNVAHVGGETHRLVVGIEYVRRKLKLLQNDEASTEELSGLQREVERMSDVGYVPAAPVSLGTRWIEGFKEIALLCDDLDRFFECPRSWQMSRSFSEFFRAI